MDNEERNEESQTEVTLLYFNYQTLQKKIVQML